MSDYIKSLENGTPVTANGNDGLQSLKIGLAAIMSLQENRPVKLEEINQFQSIKMLK